MENKINELLTTQNELVAGFRASLDSTNRTLAEQKELQSKFAERMNTIDSAIKNIEAEIAMNKAIDLSAAVANKNSNHSKLFCDFIRRGDENIKDALRNAEKQMYQNSGEVIIGTDSQGGYAVPEELSRVVEKMGQQLNIARKIFRVISVSTPDYKELVDLGGAQTGWVGETDSRPQTNAPTLAEVSPVMTEIYANAYASKWALDDMFFDVQKWITESIATAFNNKEEAGFLVGSGSSGQPKGLFAQTTAATADDSRSFGTFEHMATGDASGLKSGEELDTFLKLMNKLNPSYLPNAKFLMNRNLKLALMLLKDSQNRHMWQPSYQAGQPDLFYGREVIISDYVPATAANALICAFGDFEKAYTIVDRKGVTLIRDQYSAKPYIAFYMTKRLGSMAKLSDAVKFLKVSA